VLRGIFLLRKQELDWFYQRGASVIYPDAWEPYLSHIPENERSDLLSAYHRRLTSDDPAVRLAAAKIWSSWEGVTSKLLPDAAFAGHYEEDEFALAFARIEVHYFLNKGFFETDDQLLCGASRIRHIPGVIVQGRYDVVCPMESAWALHRAWPEADLIITPDSGHSPFDPPNSCVLVAATDRFRLQLILWLASFVGAELLLCSKSPEPVDVLWMTKLLRAALRLSIRIVARKLIQESTKFGFNRCDLGPQVRIALDKLHDSVLAECGCLIVSGTSEQCDHRFCEPIAVATLVYGRQQHGHELPQNPS
jgi:proline iminopeptidase